MTPQETVAKPRVAVVTEASFGIGLALARALARHGFAVAGLSSSPFDPGHAGVLPIQADVADPQSVTRAFDEIRSRLGAPAVLVNNSETYPDRDILDETPDSFAATLARNLGGAVACCHAVLPDMIAAGSGRIINVVTFADIDPAPLSAAYSVSKGALRIFTRALVADLGDRFPGIVINDWIPGTHTPRKGIPDGVDPEAAAEWGVRLALMDGPGISGRVFLRDREHRPPRSLKGRLKDRVLARSAAPLHLG